MNACQPFPSDLDNSNLLRLKKASYCVADSEIEGKISGYSSMLMNLAGG